MRNISQTMSKNMIFVKTQKAKRWSFPPPGSKTQERDAETPMRQTVVRYESPSMLKLEWRVLIFFLLPAFCSHISFLPKTCFGSLAKPLYLSSSKWESWHSERRASPTADSASRSGRERNAAWPRSSDGVAQNVKLSLVWKERDFTSSRTLSKVFDSLVLLSAFLNWISSECSVAYNSGRVWLGDMLGQLVLCGGLQDVATLQSEWKQRLFPKKIFFFFFLQEEKWNEQRNNNNNKKIFLPKQRLCDLLSSPHEKHITLSST